MKVLYKKNYETPALLEDDFTTTSLRTEIEKTRLALDSAYAGFDYAVDSDMIDSYIYEINALQKRYKHLCDLSAAEAVTAKEKSYEHSPIRALVSHVFG